MKMRQIFGDPKSMKRPIASMQTPMMECPPMKIVLLEKYRTVKAARMAPKKPETPMK
jgi:hypothetical protein